MYFIWSLRHGLWAGTVLRHYNDVRAPAIWTAQAQQPRRPELDTILGRVCATTGHRRRTRYPHSGWKSFSIRALPRGPALAHPLIPSLRREVAHADTAQRPASRDTAAA